MQRPRTKAFAGLLIALAVLLGWAVLSRPAAPGPTIGLFTSLPLVWGEGEDLGKLLSSDRPPHRAMAAMADIGTVRPLDTLEQLGPDLKRLVIAQPRPLSPAENVALDNWVRGGGQLLLLADPLLTEHSAYPLGDPRRPQDVVLLSPILKRWSLELAFDEGQPAGLKVIDQSGLAIPVNLPGAWRGTSPDCTISAQTVLAVCTVGQGRVTALADAEILAAEDPEALRDPAWADLLQQAFVNP